MPAIMLKSYTVYSDFSRNPLTSLETHRRKSQHSDGIKPYTPRQEEPPAWSTSPGGGSLLLSGDVLRGLGSPGKAMAEKVVASEPGPRGEGRMPQGQEQEGRRSYLPGELRIRLFDEVDKLRREGLTYSEIIEEMRRRYGVRLFKSHISYWTHGLHSPYNGRRYLPLTDSLEVTPTKPPPPLLPSSHALRLPIYNLYNKYVCGRRDLNPGPAGVPAVCSGPRRPTWLDYGRLLTHFSLNSIKFTLSVCFRWG
jgi:hypothetical protein